MFRVCHDDIAVCFYCFPASAFRVGFIVAFVIAVLLAFEWWRHEPSHDSVAGWMLRELNIPTWFVFWVSLAILLGVVTPRLIGNDVKWFEEAPSQVITVVYILLVPIFLWTYLDLIQESRSFFKGETLCALGVQFNGSKIELSLKGNKVFNIRVNIFSIILTMVLMLFAVKSIILEELKSPWVQNDQLSVVGYIYYVIVRGFNTYLLIGINTADRN